MKDVFISYKTEEFDEANWVRSTLETNGISCWMAPMCIPGGSSYAVEIPQAIKNCTVFVLLLSEKSQASKWVPRELDQAINEGKIIMPFMLENCALKDDFNFYLTNVQRYNAYESKAATMQKMIAEIKAVLGQKVPTPQSESALTPEKTPSETVAPDPAPKVNTVPVAPAPQPVPAAPKAAPAAKVKPAPAQTKGKKKRLPVVAAVVAAVVLLCVVLPLVLNALNTITIAGESFKKNASSVRLEDKTLSQADILRFGELEDLGAVYLTGCQLEGSLKALTQREDGLYSLGLAGCNVTQEQLATLDLTEDITWMDLSGNPEITDLSGVVTDAMTSLYHLNISDTGVRDITPLSGLTDLQTLYVNRLELTSLKAVEACIYLEELHAVGNRLATLEGLENTSLLRKVYLNGNALTDITPLARSAKDLLILQVSHNALTNLNALQGCEKLEYLCADGNRLTDVEVLKSCRSLRGVSLADNAITAVAPWQLVGDSVYMDLSGNRITGSVSIAGEQATVRLNVSGNPLENVELPAGHRYACLYLQDGYGVSADKLESILAATTGDILVVDYSEGMEALATDHVNNFTEYKIVDCPLNAQVALQEKLGSYRVEFITADEAAQLMMGQPVTMEYAE